MFLFSRWLIFSAFLLVIFIQPCIALELIISDSGRNQSFSSNLNSGDNFSSIGADGNPVGGTLSGTHPIEQFLVPMPSVVELEQMSTNQEKIWTKNLGGMLKDRVHIATTNGAEVFEIRLLQDTPKPENSDMSWQEPAHAERYANMTYRAIGQLVKDLKEQETPVRITAALADSGGKAFARSVNAWKPYADTFRRVDFVDARAMHTDVRQVIKILSPKRVRIINTDASVAAPPMTIARSEVVNNLLVSNPGVSVYTLKPDLKVVGKPETTPWLSSLAGYKSYRVERMQYVDNKIVNQQLRGIATGQDFRAPKRGWDPVNSDLYSTEYLNHLGIVATSSHNKANFLQNIISIFNPTTAKQWYAQQRDIALSQARGSGVAAGLTASAYDIIGGYIPGKAETPGQGYAQVMWSIATGGGSAALKGVGIARSAASSVINSAEGNYVGAGFDIVGLSGTAAGGKATEKLSTPFLKGNQYEFSFMSPEIVKTADNLKNLNIITTGVGHARNIKKTYDISSNQKSNEPIVSNQTGVSSLHGSTGSEFSLAQQQVSNNIGKMPFSGSQHYDPNSKQAQPGDIGIRTGSAGTIPHGINYWGLRKEGDLHFDSIELLQTKNGGTIIGPKHWTADKGQGMNFYRPLESKNIDVIYQDKKMKLKDLPIPVKEEIINLTYKYDVSRIGSSVGKYKPVGLKDSSNQCIDGLLNPFEKAISDSGVTILDRKGNHTEFRNHFRFAKTANPMSWPSIPELGIGAIGASMKKVEPPYITRSTKTNIISLSNSMATNGKATSEMRLVNSIINRQNNVTLQGHNPVFERLKFDNNVKVANDPLGIKQDRGTMVRMKPSTPAYRAVFPTLSRYEDAKYGNTMQSSKMRELGLSQYSSKDFKPDFPDYDRDRKLKPVDYHFYGGGGPPGPPGGSMRNITSRMFPVSEALNNANMNKYLPISTIGQQKFGQPNVRGVLLRGAASLSGGSEAFGKGDVSLVFQDSAGEIDIDKLRRFVTSLWASYLSVEGPGISIDPVEPKMDYQEVRHIGQVKNTYLACVMRETDYLMKQWAIGTHRPDIEGFLTSDDISELLKMEKSEERVTGRASRFWLVPEGLAFTRSGNMLLLSGGQMTVQTEYLDDNPKGEKNDANEAFAQWFTKNYSLISAHFPIFQELFDYAQLVSLGTFLRENRVPMLKFLLANRELIITEKSIDKVDKLKKESDYEWNISISGGVELEATESVRDQGRYKTDESLKEDFNYANSESAESDVLSDTVVFNSKATDYTVSSNQSLMLSGSLATGDIVQTDFAYWKEYEEKAGKEKWNLVAPAMELIRHYNPNIETRAQLGLGWHLLVPFRLENSEVSKPLVPGKLPSRIAMVNLLSGEREVMEKIIDKKTNIIQYIPLDKNALVSLLNPLSNSSWVLMDRLGAKFLFDKEGDLTHMELRPEKTISFKVGEKTSRKTIPGYIVEYNYETQVIAGHPQKLLMSVKQGAEIASIIRGADNQLKYMASIRILNVEQSNPIEILTYTYDNDNRLVKVANKNGYGTDIMYKDDEMRIVSTHM